MQKSFFSFISPPLMKYNIIGVDFEEMIFAILFSSRPFVSTCASPAFLQKGRA